MTKSKYELSKRIDALIDRTINREFRRRMSRDRLGFVTDSRLQQLLENQERFQDLDRRISGLEEHGK